MVFQDFRFLMGGTAQVFYSLYILQTITFVLL